MIDMTRYNELLKVNNEFSFLKNAIKQNGIKGIFTVNDLLNDEFINKYDTETDICNILEFNLLKNDDPYLETNYYGHSDTDKELAKYLFDNNKFNILFKYKCFKKLEGLSYTEKNNLEVIKHIIIEMMKYCLNLKIDDNYFNLNSSIYENNENNIKLMIYFQYIFQSKIFTFLHNKISQNKNYNLYTDLMNLFDDNDLDIINNYFKKLILIQKSYSQLYYLKNYQYTINNIMNSVYSLNNNLSEVLKKYIEYIYNNLSSSDINDLCKNKFDKIQNLFDYLQVEYKRKVTLLNDKLSDEERTELLKTFKSAAAIKGLCDNMINNKTETIERIDFIFESCIINNSKIKDRNYPKTKDKVVIETIRNLFITEHGYGKSIYDFISAEDIIKLIKKYKYYFYNPYFIESIYNTASMWSNRCTTSVSNSKTLLKILFKTNTELKFEIKEFVQRYMSNIIISKTERENPCSHRIDAGQISFGSLYYLLKNMISIESEENIYKYLILDNIEELDDPNFSFYLFYASVVHDEEILEELLHEVLPSTNDGTRLSTNRLEIISPLRKWILVELNKSLYNSQQNYYRDFNVIQYMQQLGSINSLLGIFIHKDDNSYIRSLIQTNIYSADVYCYRNAYEHELSDIDLELIHTAKKFIILKYIEKLNTELYINKDKINKSLKDFYNFIDKDINTKNIICQPSCIDATFNESNNKLGFAFTNKNEYFNFIDFDSILLYRNLMQLNKKYGNFNIDDSFDNVIFIPILSSLANSSSMRYNRRYNTSYSQTKYDKESCNYAVFNRIQNMTDDDKQYIYNKFIKLYVDNDFLFNENVSQPLIQFSDKLVKYIDDNRYNGVELRYYLYSNICDTKTDLINNSIADTFVKAYKDFFDDFYDKQDYQQELKHFNDGLDQMAMNYNCLQSLIN